MNDLPAALIDVALKSSLLNGLATQDAKSILRAATLRRFSPGSLIYSHGDRIRSLYLLVDGRARYFTITPEGRKIVFMLVLPGEVLGGAALLASMSSYLLSAEVLKDSRVLIWERETIRDLALRHPKLLDNSLEIAGGYVEWLLSAHIGLVCQSAQLRLAHVLAGLARDVGSKVPGGIELTVTNEELANSANVTPFTASRLIRDWHRRGVLKKGRGKLVLLSPEGLFGNLPKPSSDEILACQ